MPGPIVLAIVSDFEVLALRARRLRPVHGIDEGGEVVEQLLRLEAAPPNGAWMIAVLSTRNSTRPPLTSLTARSMSKVIVPPSGSA
jgi:hypothetical protein